MNYGLITHGVEVDFRSFSSVQAHLNSLSSKDVSRKIFFFLLFLSVLQGFSSNHVCFYSLLGVLG